MNPEQVAQYLQDHPQFFEEHLELMTNLVVPHPHSRRSICRRSRTGGRIMRIAWKPGWNGTRATLETPVEQVNSRSPIVL